MLSLGALCILHTHLRDDLRNDSRLLWHWQHAVSPSRQAQTWADPGPPASLSPSRNIRVAVLPCSESTTCLFRTRPLDASDALVFNEVFWVSMSYPALHQKTLRVDVCTTDQSRPEDCLVRAVSVCPSVLWGVVHRVPQGEGLEERLQAQLGFWAGTFPRQTASSDFLGGEFHRRRSDRPESVL